MILRCGDHFMRLAFGALAALLFLTTNSKAQPGVEPLTCSIRAEPTCELGNTGQLKAL
jgi:hypothetical protein